jgi:hypothetical protein
MSNAVGMNLPAYTTIENIISLLETLKFKKDDDEVKAIFQKGNSAYTNTKSVLRAFDFIEKDSLEFTEIGRKIAYSSDQDKKVYLTNIFNICKPYEIFLLHLLNNNTDVTASTLDDIVNFWGQANYGSTERNRQDAAKLFMGIVKHVEFGKYIIGRGQNPTRIEWVPDIKDKINKLFPNITGNVPIAKTPKNDNIQKGENQLKPLIILLKKMISPTNAKLLQWKLRKILPYI